MIAQRYGHDPDWVKARLRRADVPLRAPGRQATTDEDRVRSLLDHGLRVPEIAGALDCSTTTVLTIMRKHSWVGPPRRPRGPNRTPPPTPDPAVLRRLYSMRGSASERSPSACTCVVRAALHTAGVPVSNPGWVAGQAPAPISKEQLHRLYVDQDSSARQVAEELKCAQARVLAALRRHGIPVHAERRRTVPPLLVDAAIKGRVYVAPVCCLRPLASRARRAGWSTRKRPARRGLRWPLRGPRRMTHAHSPQGVPSSRGSGSTPPQDPIATRQTWTRPRPLQQEPSKPIQSGRCAGRTETGQRPRRRRGIVAQRARLRAAASEFRPNEEAAPRVRHRQPGRVRDDRPRRSRQSITGAQWGRKAQTTTCLNRGRADK